ncbi:MAG: hypothetical protein QXP52_02265 [Candidatus Aenigmatarchaeota archaeon]
MNVGKCFYCGKEGEFQTWMYYDLKLKKHVIATWCSNKCLEKAFKKVNKKSKKYHCELCAGKL